MKRVFILSFVGAVMQTLPSVDLAWGKNHVPLDQEQACVDGHARNIVPSQLPTSHIVSRV